jgi:hypothetical protein
MPDVKDPRLLHRAQVQTDEQALTVFRFVHCADVVDPGLVDDFLSDRAAGKPRRGRALALAEIWDGFSCFRTLELARARWSDIATLARGRGQTPRVGSFIAEVRLSADKGFACEDLGHDDGHLTVWGEPALLASATINIHPAEL